MNTGMTIKRLIDLSSKKLNIMHEKAQLVEDEVYFTKKKSSSELSAINTLKSVLEEKLLSLDIEFLKLYENVLEREGLAKLTEIDAKKHPALIDLQVTIHKIKKLEANIIIAEDTLYDLRESNHNEMKAESQVKKHGQRVANVYQKQMDFRNRSE